MELSYQSSKNKTSSAVNALAKVRNLLLGNIKLTIYNSIFQSYVESGISYCSKNACPDMKKNYFHCLLITQKP